MAAEQRHQACGRVMQSGSFKILEPFDVFGREFDSIQANSYSVSTHRLWLFPLPLQQLIASRIFFTLAGMAWVCGSA